MTQIGIVLVDINGRYRDNAGNLPPRPSYDKFLLLDMVRDRVCLASPNTLEALPPSVRFAADRIVTPGSDKKAAVNLGIATFDSHPPKKMIVVRSTLELPDGPFFRLPGGKRYHNNTVIPMSNSQLEIYS